jgi:hypothetical protein
VKRSTIFGAMVLALITLAWSPMPTTTKCCWPWAVNNLLLDAACQDDCRSTVTCIPGTWEEVTDAHCETRPRKSCTLLDNQNFLRRQYDCLRVECELANGNIGARCTRGIAASANVLARKCSGLSDLCTFNPI